MELKIRDEVIEKDDAGIGGCTYEDYAGGRCDALRMKLSDTEKAIRRMNLKKGDAVSVKHGGINTGEMYITEIEYSGDGIGLRAVSMDLNCKKAKNDAKANISFYEMAKDVETETGYTLVCMDVKDVRYAAITRINKNPMQYIARRMELEGYAVKVHDRRIIIFDEAKKEREPAGVTITEGEFSGNPAFSTNDARLIASVTNTYQKEGRVIRTFVESGLSGKALTENMAVSCMEESERFSRGIMRLANKNEYVMGGWISGLERRAGETIDLDTDIYGHAGLNYIYAVEHDLINERQLLSMRRPIEGGY